jgi:hypothetical protein
MKKFIAITIFTRKEKDYYLEFGLVCELIEDYHKNLPKNENSFLVDGFGNAEIKNWVFNCCKLPG